MYKLFKLPSDIFANIVIRITDNVYIPFDPDNTDYQAYLEWLAEGNQPLPADEASQ